LELAVGRSQHDVVCMTCGGDDDVDSQVPPCQFVDALFSPSSMFYVDACLGPRLPRYVLKSIADNVQRINLPFSYSSSVVRVDIV